ncbi:GntR family transcriptional regulator [Ferviditalea candida]|uniref:GntR family transcriptional regulator n=1 Tax=Ferviditalea candida TaxID=3108399 RepID=A0ABU5ZGT8_9BACL|nr:GntR family transcriptional regulator [Paenibacillaceae bacterium T2]
METQKSSISKKQIAYDFIRSQIVNGYFGPGHRIVIDQIAKELKLSIIPVREAIRQLESDGLIQYKAYSGAIVSQINEVEYRETLSVLAVLEGYATALSSRLIPPKEIDLLKEINANMSRALFDFEFEQFSELNRKFHSVIYEFCNNQYLKEQIHQTWERMSRVRQTVFTFVPQRAKESIQEHDQIIEMIRHQDSFAKIEEFVRQHKMNTVKAFDNRKNPDNSKGFAAN